MRILFLCRALGMGGIEKNLVLLTDEFCQRGHEVFIGAERGSLSTTLQERGAVCFEQNLDPSNPVRFLQESKRLGTFIADIAPDVIHVFSAMSAIALTLARISLLRPKRASTGGPIVVSSIMGLEEGPNEHALKTKFRTMLTVQGAKKVYVISPKIRQHLEGLPIAQKRLKDLHVVGVLPLHGYEKSARESVREQLGITKYKVVVTIGRLAPRKSHELFIHAAAKILEHNDEVCFLILGEGPDKEKLQELIDSLDVSKQVRLVGIMTDLPRLFAATDVCVKPGVVEGFIGVTVLEAQATGTPVVAFDTEDVRLAIEDGVTGLLAKNGDSSDLAEKISALLSDPVLAERIGQSGQVDVRKHWAIDRIADSLLAEYSSLSLED